MEAVLRAVTTYFFLFVVFRELGKRAMAQITTFDFILLLIIGESTQQSLLGYDFSVTNSFIVIATLLITDFTFNFLANRVKPLQPWLEDVPLILVDRGKVRNSVLKKLGVSEDDILEAGRRYHGIERMDQIKYAIIEKDGSITVVPFFWQENK